MSCSPEVVSWMDECYGEAAASAEAEAREVEAHAQGLMSFKKEIKDASEKTTFMGTHLAHGEYRRYANPDIGYGYEISCATPLSQPKTKEFPVLRWSSALVCCYDPKRDNIMFEVWSVQRGYSRHTMVMSRFEKLISENQIIIKKM